MQMLNAFFHYSTTKQAIDRQFFADVILSEMSANVLKQLICQVIEQSSNQTIDSASKQATKHTNKATTHHHQQKHQAPPPTTNNTKPISAEASPNRQKAHKFAWLCESEPIYAQMQLIAHRRAKIRENKHTYIIGDLLTDRLYLAKSDFYIMSYINS